MPENNGNTVPGNSTYNGELQINVTSTLGMIPVPNARVSITYTSQPETTVEELNTDSSGQTPRVPLAAPPIEYSMEPESGQRPYAEYNIQVSAPGYEPALIQGSEILPDVTAVQSVQLRPVEVQDAPEEVIMIPDHTLYGDYPPKIPEEEIKPVDETGEIVLSRVVVPEYIVGERQLGLRKSQGIKRPKPFLFS